MANAIARQLRKRMTPQEVKLWVRLRELRELAIHFRRQSPTDNYIVDFVRFGFRLIVEVDGGQHALDAERDRIRDARFEKNGFRVLRFWNSDIDSNLDGVVETIARACGQSHHPGALRAPTLPARGRD